MLNLQKKNVGATSSRPQEGKYYKWKIYKLQKYIHTKDDAGADYISARKKYKIW